MIKKISTSLFNPRIIGTYITEKFSKSVLYFFIMSIFVTLPGIISLFSVTNVNLDVTETLVTELQKEEIDLNLVDNKLIGSEEIKIETSDCHIVFLSEYVSTEVETYSFEENEVVYYTLGTEVSRVKYEEFKLTELTIGSNSTYFDAKLIENILEQTKEEAMITLRVGESIAYFMTILLEYALMLLILYSLGRAFNPHIRGKFGVTIAIYALTPRFVCDFFYASTGVTALTYIGIIWSLFATYKAFKAIVAIRKIDK